MSVWMWTLISLWGSGVLLAFIALSRTIRMLKALRNVYFHRAFDDTLNRAGEEFQSRPTSLWRTCSRIIHQVGCITYRDPQFQLPPSLHALVMLAYFSLLLLFAYIADFLSPSDYFSPAPAVLVSLCGTVSGLFLILVTEVIFVRSLNRRNALSPESLTVNTVPMENDPIGLNRTRPQLDEYETHEKMHLHTEDIALREKRTEVVRKPESKENVRVEIALLAIAVIVCAAALWGIFTIENVEVRSCTLHWVFGVCVDIPYRVLLALLLSYCDFLPSYESSYHRLPYSIPPKKLGQFLNVPRNSEPPYSPPPPSLLPSLLPSIYTEEEDNSMFPAVSVIPPTHRLHYLRNKTDPQSILTIDELTENHEEKHLKEFATVQPEEKPEEAIIEIVEEKPTIETAIDHQSSIDHRSSIGRRSSIDEESEIHTVLSSYRSSFPVTDRDPHFTPAAVIPPIEDISEDCPMLMTRLTATPEAEMPPPAFDEFPFPSVKERFSDIEGSHGDTGDEFMEPSMPDIPETVVNKRVAESHLMGPQKTVKPGYFSSGQPIESVRKNRNSKRKGRRLQLEAIASENEEDLEENARSRSLMAQRRANSPEPADSTRYQTPAGPLVFQNEEYVRVYPEPIVRDFRSVRPVLDGEIELRIDSPQAADEMQISFMSSESSTATVALGRASLPSIILEGGKRSNKKTKKKPNRFVVPVDSPYQEILWKRVEGESGNPYRRKKTSSRMTRHASLSPLAQQPYLSTTASRGTLLNRRPPHPWY